MEYNISRGNDLDRVFTFETDHLALRGNREYSQILKTICLLEAQKIQIHKDIEQLTISKNEYLLKPSDFIKDILRKKFIAPNYLSITPIPETGKKKVESVSDNEVSGDITNVDVKVRGRIFDQTKPETFNQLWTCDEQRRLEQLLVEYPAEAIEMRRFSKIANALGNRTPQQVASRVQKFFKKLHSVGMPVPGRIPKSKKYALPKSKQSYRNVCRRSTFFPAHDVPVNIPEDDLFNAHTENTALQLKSSITLYDENDKSNIKKNVLNMLHAIRYSKLLPYNEQLIENDFRCDICLKQLRAQSIWTCNTCYCKILMCEDCSIHQIISNEYVHINHDVIFNVMT